MSAATPDRSHLPIPEQSFGGVAGRTVAESTPDWAITAEVEAPEGAPNVLLILIDDAGFGQASTFGGRSRRPRLTGSLRTA
ncbi:hypothetical protein [Microbacterium schleiferi]|uniref:hypothetical protein n=1 Tax=Microbacterium schleiferi TaxID=69362 RepID=UPI001E352E09|nr:hypothetical protein [Microbacterium schleiferi]